MLRSPGMGKPVSAAWGDITGKPSTFPPSSHTHVIGDVTGLQSALDAKLSTVSWSSVTGKPTTFDPSPHTHVMSDITGLAAAISGATTPLATNAALADAVSGAVGTSSKAAREDHVHPLPTGRLVALGNVTVTETLLLSLSLGMKRMAITLTGVVAGDKLFFAPNGVPTTGCEAVNVYASATNQVTVSYFVPALGIGATYSIPITVYRVT